MKPPLRSLRVAALLWVACAAPPASAQILEPATPASVGISEARLERWDRLARAYVDSSRIAGVVSLVARDGKLVHLRAYGSLDVEEGRPMRTDALFRIASMTKAVTSVAAMMLVEEGRLALDEPVSRYIPAFAASLPAAAKTTATAHTLPSTPPPRPTRAPWSTLALRRTRVPWSTLEPRTTPALRTTWAPSTLERRCRC